MYTASDIMFMYAETSVHVGGGESVGAIDLAIAREKYTDFPFIPSSGVKGALRSHFSHQSNLKDQVSAIFGPENDGAEHAGAAVFTDARILLFPVRSLKGVFAWITCPLVIERFNRDLRLAGHEGKGIPVPAIDSDKAIVSSESENTMDGKVVLEEYSYGIEEKEINEFVNFLTNTFPDLPEYDYWKKKLKTNLVILSDDEFRDFAKSSTEVQARIRINSETKTVDSGALFYQENLPSDTLMYTVVAAHNSFKKEDDQNADDIFKTLKKLNTQSVQLGGNESVGKGIFNLNFLNGNGGK